MWCCVDPSGPVTFRAPQCRTDCHHLARQHVAYCTDKLLQWLQLGFSSLSCWRNRRRMCSSYGVWACSSYGVWAHCLANLSLLCSQICDGIEVKSIFFELFNSCVFKIKCFLDVRCRGNPFCRFWREAVWGFLCNGGFQSVSQRCLAGKSDPPRCCAYIFFTHDHACKPLSLLSFCRWRRFVVFPICFDSCCWNPTLHLLESYWLSTELST